MHVLWNGMDESSNELNSLSDLDNSKTDNDLLSPLCEVSYSEREAIYSDNASTMKELDGQEAKSSADSLPDARAKVLHLQRVQRESSNDTKSSTNSNKRKSKEDEEKEETVSFSLESIIRRGLNEQKLNTNFKSNFTKIDPSDDISLRVNPTANLFYEHENSDLDEDDDTTSESYVSERQASDSGSIQLIRRNSRNKDIETNVNNVEQQQDDQIISNGNNVTVEKRKRGRPKLSIEEKMKRQVKFNLAKRSRKESVFDLNQPLPTDDLLTIEHSIFSEEMPKRRGRRRKEQQPPIQQTPSDEYFTSDTFAENNVSVEIKQENGDVVLPSNNSGKHVMFQLNSPSEESVTEPIKKKRGPKPKNKQTVDEQYMRKDQFIDNRSVKLSTSLPVNGVTTTGKKRGRKPKNTESYYVKLNQSQIAELEARQDVPLGINNNNNYNSNISEAAVPTTSVVPVKKKRGRKPKNFYLSQSILLHDNVTASAPLESRTVGEAIKSNSFAGAQSGVKERRVVTFEVPKKKRGRKPKNYYQQMQLETNNSSVLPSPVSIMSQSLPNMSVDSVNVTGPKKRGRKPKSFYLQFQPQTQQQNQNTTIGNQSTPINNYQFSVKSEPSSRTNNMDEDGENASTSNMSPNAYAQINKKKVIAFNKSPKILKRPTSAKQKMLLKKKLLASKKLKKPVSQDDTYLTN